MFSPYSMELFKEDPFNRLRKRNADNTDDCDYNCGGYALGTYSWYLPSYDDKCWGFFKRYNKERVVEITEEAVEIMLRDFTDLRLITDLRQVQWNEYAIAFRVSSDGDFHYCKQESKKRWTHKRGNTKICRISEKYIFGNIWYGRYNGPIILFAKKRG